MTSMPLCMITLDNRTSSIMEKEKGKFIVFEGVDGSGKTTQIEKLRRKLISDGKEVHVTKSLGGTSMGVLIRRLLLHKEVPRTTVTELLMMFASRAEVVSTMIKPLLDNGVYVICDRYNASTYAYQGTTDKLRELILYLSKNEEISLKVDKMFLLSIKNTTAYDRVGKNKDLIERRGLNYFKEVNDRYVEYILLDNNVVSGEIVAIDAEQSIDVVHEDILKYF